MESSDSSSAEDLQDINSIPPDQLEVTEVQTPDGSTVKCYYRGVDPRLTLDSKEWKKAKRLADNRASAARSRALSRLKVNDLEGRMGEVLAQNAELRVELARLRALLSGGGGTVGKGAAASAELSGISSDTTAAIVAAGGAGLSGSGAATPVSLAAAGRRVKGRTLSGSGHAELASVQAPLQHYLQPVRVSQRAAAVAAVAVATAAVASLSTDSSSSDNSASDSSGGASSACDASDHCYGHYNGSRQHQQQHVPAAHRRRAGTAGSNLGNRPSIQAARARPAVAQIVARGAAAGEGLGSLATFPIRQPSLLPLASEGGEDQDGSSTFVSATAPTLPTWQELLGDASLAPVAARQLQNHGSHQLWSKCTYGSDSSSGSSVADSESSPYCSSLSVCSAGSTDNAAAGSSSISHSSYSKCSSSTGSTINLAELEDLDLDCSSASGLPELHWSSSSSSQSTKQTIARSAASACGLLSSGLLRETSMSAPVPFAGHCKSMSSSSSQCTSLKRLRCLTEEAESSLLQDGRIAQEQQMGPQYLVDSPTPCEPEAGNLSLCSGMQRQLSAAVQAQLQQQEEVTALAPHAAQKRQRLQSPTPLVSFGSGFGRWTSIVSLLLCITLAVLSPLHTDLVLQTGSLAGSGIRVEAFSASGGVTEVAAGGGFIRGMSLLSVGIMQEAPAREEEEEHAFSQEEQEDEDCMSLSCQLSEELQECEERHHAYLSWQLSQEMPNAESVLLASPAALNATALSASLEAAAAPFALLEAARAAAVAGAGASTKLTAEFLICFLPAAALLVLSAVKLILAFRCSCEKWLQRHRLLLQGRSASLRRPLSSSQLSSWLN